jgi:hypothetical protein
MSRGAGEIEQRIGDLFAATRHRGLSVADIADHAFALNGAPASRAQRLSATRAAHRLGKRVRQGDERADRLKMEAYRQTTAALGREQRVAGSESDTEYLELLRSLPAWREREKLWEYCYRIGIWVRLMPTERPGRVRFETDYWCTTTIGKGGAARLYFHPPDAPVQVWAVALDACGVHWFDAEVTRITELNVMVSYAGERARLDRGKLWRWWAWWRGVRFVSSRTGRVAKALDEIWQERYGHATGGVPPQMQMPLAEAMELLGVPANYTREDVIAAFRREVKKAHPDMGGTAEMFHRLVKARDRLLAAIGTSAPAPKMPTYYASGTRIVYRRQSRGRPRIGYIRRLAAG